MTPVFFDLPGWPLHAEPSFWGSPPAGGSSSAAPRRFTVARDCGHYTRVSDQGAAGCEWCGHCGRYVGLIVSETP